MKSEFSKFRKVEQVPDFYNAAYKGKNYDLLSDFWNSGWAAASFDMESDKEASKRAANLRCQIRKGKYCSEYKGKVSVHNVNRTLYLVRIAE